MFSIQSKEQSRYHLENEVYAVVYTLNGETYFDIRQYKLCPISGVCQPTCRGVTLNPSRFTTLSYNMPAIDENFSYMCTNDPIEMDFCAHLGGGIFVTLKTGQETMDIRLHYVRKGSTKLYPKWNGVNLSYDAWCKLKLAINNAKDISLALRNAEPCYFNEAHCNFETSQFCEECNPFGDIWCIL